MEEHVTVAATRTDKRIEDQPMRVEVLDREEIEEKLMMTPGDIVMMLNEMGGLRVQATSPSLGAASVRIQGMRGRYTRFLSDGLPLFGEQVGSFGLLQIPPMDLAQVEVIKGVASSLYGAGAMGGVVNLVSRRPGKEPERELLVNRSSRGATDGVFWTSRPLSPTWGMTLLAGAHGQEQADVNGDDWADLPHYARGIVRPRVFWDDHAGRSFFATAGAMWEDRSGGTLSGKVLAPLGSPYVEGAGHAPDRCGCGRADAYRRRLHRDRACLARARASGPPVWRRPRARHSRHSLRRDCGPPRDGPAYLGGGCGGRARRPSSRRICRASPTPHTVPGVFVQDDVDLRPWLSLSASGRLDAHSEFGTFFSPRVSALLKAEGGRAGCRSAQDSLRRRRSPRKRKRLACRDW